MSLLASDAYRTAFRYAPFALLAVAVFTFVMTFAVSGVLRFLADKISGHNGESASDRSKKMQGRLFSSTPKENPP